MANEILKFCGNGTATDLLTQSEYSADPQRLIGNQPGIARQKLVNKVLRQCAFISNGFAEYIISKIGGDILDDDDTAALVTKIGNALAVPFTNRNYILNSNMDFWQRYLTRSVTSLQYVADRYVNDLLGTTATVARQSTLGSESFIAKYFMRLATTSVVGVSNFYNFSQRIEGVRNSSGKTFTLTFWAKADSARNLSIEFTQNFGTGGSPSASVDSIGIQKFSLTTAWQKFSKTVTFPSISGKVLGTANNDYFALIFWLDAGTNFNSRTDSLGQQSGTFDIAQVKLEDGLVATDFSLAGGDIAGELSLCQRYFEKSYNIDLPLATISTNGVTSVISTSAGTFETNSVFKVTKRTAPVFTTYSPSTGATGVARDETANDNKAVNVLNVSESSARVVNAVAFSAVSRDYFQWSADSEL